MELSGHAGAADKDQRAMKIAVQARLGTDKGDANKKSCTHDVLEIPVRKNTECWESWTGARELSVVRRRNRGFG